MDKIIKIKDIKEKYIRDIETDYDKLSVRSQEIDYEKKGSELQDIVINLKTNMREKKITALSAIQLGIEKRVICIDFNGDIRTFVDPIITKTGEMELSRETCHSIPNKTFIIPRYNKLEITYFTPLKKVQSIELVGLAARIMQHHIDHLNGLLLCDIGLEIDEDFDNASDKEKQQIVDMYLDSLDIKKNTIEEEIKDDKEAQDIINAAKFFESVQKGETKIDKYNLTKEESDEIRKQIKEQEEDESRT